jgi:hypothetical protein
VRVKTAPPAGAAATSERSAVAVPVPDAIAGRTSKEKPWTAPSEMAPASVVCPVVITREGVVAGWRFCAVMVSVRLPGTTGMEKEPEPSVVAVVAVPVTVTTARATAIPVEASRTVPMTVPDGGLIVRGVVFVTAEAVPVIVAVIAVPTAFVVIANVAVVVPAGTVTFAGTVAAALSDDRLTGKPPDGAGAVRVTVPVDGTPPVSEAGFSAREARARGTGLMVSVAVFVTPAAEAVSWTVAGAPTKLVGTLNVAAVAPPTIVTFVGTVAAVLSLDKLTSKPLVIAMPVSVTVPITGVPPPTAIELMETPARVGGLTVSDAVCVTPE